MVIAKLMINNILQLGCVSEGNEILLLNDGDRQFYLMRKAILKATKTVWLETYIYQSDKIGQYILDALIEVAKRGCQVIVLYDDFGSNKLNNNFLKPLVDIGVKVFVFNPILSLKRNRSALCRDHRKILIIDNYIGFCGGINIAQDYADIILGNGYFRDTLIRLKGSCVCFLSNLFLYSLKETVDSKDVLYIHQRYSIYNGSFVQVLGSNKSKNLYSIQHAIEIALYKSVKYCYLTSPYFLPHYNLYKAIISAAQRGVDVRILSAGLSDILCMRNASQYIYLILLQYGVRIFEMFKKTLHAKTITIDGYYSFVGSYNLDYWSAMRNLEINVFIANYHIAHELKKHFFQDLKYSNEVMLDNLNKQSILQRFCNWCSYSLMRI